MKKRKRRKNISAGKELRIKPNGIKICHALCEEGAQVFDVFFIIGAGFDGKLIGIENAPAGEIHGDRGIHEGGVIIKGFQFARFAGRLAQVQQHFQAGTIIQFVRFLDGLDKFFMLVQLG